MSIPSDVMIQWEVLKLLHCAPARGLQTGTVYAELGRIFPCLTSSDLTEPYSSDQTGSRWNTAVRSARAKLKDQGFISHTTERGYWSLTEKGHKEVTDPLGGII